MNGWGGMGFRPGFLHMTHCAIPGFDYHLRAMAKLLDPITPGEILLEEFLKPLGISQRRLARDLGIPPTRVYSIIREHRAITAEMALRLGRSFRTSAELWLGLQRHYDIKRAGRKRGAEIKRTIRPHARRA